ncbi:MAG: TonB-dependent receptor [Flavobacteriales bacterium]|nr:TonB-dependent receptor [Flavobacteriales bacterium]
MKIISTGAMLLLAVLVHGQQVPPAAGRVLGKVYSSADGLPLPGASIAFDHRRSATADDSGHYAMELPPGACTVVARFIGYAERTLEVEIPAGGQLRLDIALQPSTSQLDMVVVSASKFEQRVGEVTQSLSVLPAALIRERGTTNLADALDQVPGVVVVDEDPQIRAGSGFSYGAGSRVMLLADGMPILSGDIGRPNWSFLPIEDVEQVEVIKGASSVLYGSAALSGVINVRSGWPGNAPKTKAVVFGGVYDAPGQADAKWWDASPPITTGASFLHGQRFKQFDLVVAGNALGDQGFIGPERIAPDSLAQDPYRTGTGGYDHRVRFTFAARWRNAKAKGLNYGLNGNVMKSRSTSVFLWDNLHEGLYRPMPNTTTNTMGTQYYLDPFVHFTGPQGTRHSLNGRYYVQQFDNSGNQSNSNEMLYGEYQVQRKLDLFGPTTFTLGLVGQRVASHAALYSGNPMASGENTATNAAAFLQVDKKLLARLMVSAGVRYERFRVNELEQAEPVVRAGATYQAWEGTFLRASYGQGFRFPTIGERYITTSVGSLHIYPNPGLQPETSVNMELGVKQGFVLGGVTGYVDMVAFQQDFDRYVEFTFGQWGTVRTPANLLGFGFKSINTGGARITGTEFELAGKGKWGAVELQVLMGYTHTLPISTTPNEAYAQTVSTTGAVQNVSYMSTSSNTGGDILKFRVQDLFRADLGLNWKRFSPGVGVRYNSHVRNIDQAFIQIEQMGQLGEIGVEQWMAEHTTGDWITDLRIGFAITGQLKASFLVYNVGNVVYAIRPMAIEAPRTFRLQLALAI